MGALDTPCDASMIGGATYHYKPTSNIDIYPSTLFNEGGIMGAVRCPHDAPHCGGVLDAPCDTPNDGGYNLSLEISFSDRLHPSSWGGVQMPPVTSPIMGGATYHWKFHQNI